MLWRLLVRLIIQFSFTVVTLLIFIIGAISLQKIRGSQALQANLVKQSVRKLQLANEMRESIHLRQISLSKMITMDDPFEFDEEILKFYQYAGIYRKAYEILHTLPLNNQEKEFNKRFTQQVRIAQPLNRKAVNLVQINEKGHSIKAAEQAQHEQYKLLNLLDEFVNLQRSYTTNAIKIGQNNFENTLSTVFTIGVIAVLLTLGIGWLITRLVANKNDELLDKNKELALAYDGAEAANKAKLEFIDSMSHELHSPLHIIMGFAQVIKLNRNIDESVKLQISEIYQAGEHLVDMVNSVLNFTKVGDIELKLEAVALDEVLHDCLLKVSPVTEEKNINVIVQPSCNEHVLLCDRYHTQNTIDILISNAVKYNHKDGEVNIYCECCDNDFLQIIISDTGTGIDPLRLKETFEPFNRLDQEGMNIRGSGLGLSIAKKLIDAMGGEIDVKSVVGEGSQFWLKLPLSNS